MNALEVVAEHEIPNGDESPHSQAEHHRTQSVQFIGRLTFASTSFVSSCLSVKPETDADDSHEGTKSQRAGQKLDDTKRLIRLTEKTHKSHVPTACSRPTLGDAVGLHGRACDFEAQSRSFWWHHSAVLDFRRSVKCGREPRHVFQATDPRYSTGEMDRSLHH